jgi:putative DNA methylase
MPTHNSSFIPHPFPIKSPRKLIEVALPLDAINVACAREKSIRHGHPSTLHLWWARRPLAAARAVLFAQLVNDPSWKWEMEHPGQIPPGNLKGSWAASRKRLFKIIEELVLWENTTNEEVLVRARAEIRRSWREVCELNKDHPEAAELFHPDKLPAFHDPFAGGGSIPLEAQRLGLEAYASDLNPVAVLINKAMIEIPPKFANRPPVCLAKSMKDEGRSRKKGRKDEGRSRKGEQTQLEFHNSSFIPHNSSWPGATGLAEDVRHYGAWMREEAQKRIGHLYPPVKVVQLSDGSYRHATEADFHNSSLTIHTLTVIAWLWTRTVKSPNPAFSHVDVPLVSTFILSSKVGKEAYVEPVIEGDHYHFTVKMGKPPKDAEKGTKLARGSFGCILSGTPMGYAYIDDEANAKRMGTRLLAIVADGTRGRVYLSPTEEIESMARKAEPTWRPETPCRGTFASNAQGRIYGFKVFGDYFTPRQLVALTTFSDLVGEARERIRQDAEESMKDELRSMKESAPSSFLLHNSFLSEGGTGATAYAEAVVVYLSFQIDQLTNHLSTLCAWHVNNEQLKNTFARQSLPMTWDFAETNPFSTSTGSLHNLQERQIKAFASLATEAGGYASQANATVQDVSRNKIVSTDPPYYDNIAYADLSDFFYVWTRRNLRSIFPTLLATIAVPKNEELVATAYRHGGKELAEAFFLDGMSKAMHRLVEQAHLAFPITIYYAFKQAETKGTATSSTGWETFLDAVFRAGFLLTGTWPVRTEQSAAMKTGTNALASSIVLVCRKRSADAPSISRREFLRELYAVLPEALDNMTRGAGSKDEVGSMKDEKGKAEIHTSSFIPHTSSFILPVDLSQAIIGPGMAVFSKYSAVLEADGTPMSVRTALQLINRFLAEDDFDADTQFCLNWFEQHGWNEGVFGEADVLARSKSTSVDAIKEAGVVQSGGGKVRLRKWAEYPVDWDPRSDKRTPVWEALHQLIRALKQGGEAASGVMLTALAGKAEAVRQLAYRLYTLCERLGQAEDARAYNELITSWTGIESAAVSSAKPVSKQMELFEE